MDSLDLAAARERFDASEDLTVGIEEEFQLLDPETLDLADRYEELAIAANEDPGLGVSVAGELISSEIEIRSGRGETLADALALQRERRAHLFALADAHGVALGATGSHPWADYRRQHIIDTKHYNRLRRDLRYVAQRNNTWSVHVHVGVRGADRAIQVCDRLRPVLPLLLAISGNSPYVDGRDSGLHSARSQIFTRNFPRCGIPDVFGSWEAWAAYVDLLSKTGSIVEFTQLWWSVRPHHDFGTVEVRICDVQGTAPESEALCALMVACVAQAMEEVDAGSAPPDLPGRLIEENLWRAIRYGQDGELLDLHAAPVTAFPSARAAAVLRDWTAPARARHGLLELPLPALNGAQRQRRMIDSGATPREVFAACVEETRTTYAAPQEVIE